MRYWPLLLAVGCVDDSVRAPGKPPLPSASSPAVSASAQPDPFTVINERKYSAIRHCEDNGGIVAMGFDWDVVCIEGQVRSYDAKTEKVKVSSTYDYSL